MMSVRCSAPKSSIKSILDQLCPASRATLLDAVRGGSISQFLKRKTPLYSPDASPPDQPILKRPHVSTEINPYGSVPHGAGGASSSSSSSSNMLSDSPDRSSKVALPPPPLELSPTEYTPDESSSSASYPIEDIVPRSLFGCSREAWPPSYPPTRDECPTKTVFKAHTNASNKLCRMSMAPWKVVASFLYTNEVASTALVCTRLASTPKYLSQTHYVANVKSSQAWSKFRSLLQRANAPQHIRLSMRSTIQTDGPWESAHGDRIKSLSMSSTVNSITYLEHVNRFQSLFGTRSHKMLGSVQLNTNAGLDRDSVERFSRLFSHQANFPAMHTLVSWKQSVMNNNIPHHDYGAPRAFPENVDGSSANQNKSVHTLVLCGNGTQASKTPLSMFDYVGLRTAALLHFSDAPPYWTRLVRHLQRWNQELHSLHVAVCHHGPPMQLDLSTRHITLYSLDCTLLSLCPGTRATEDLVLVFREPAADHDMMFYAKWLHNELVRCQLERSSMRITIYHGNAYVDPQQQPPHRQWKKPVYFRC